MPNAFPVSNQISNGCEYFHKSNSSGISSLILSYAGEEACLPGHRFGPAIRSQYLLHFITKGKGQFCVEGKTYPLKANQVFLIQPNITTYYSADTKDPWAYIWVGFDGSDARKILQDCGLLERPYVDYNPDKTLLQCLKNIIDGLQNETTNDFRLLGDLFTIFGYLKDSRDASPSGGGGQQPLFDRRSRLYQNQLFQTHYRTGYCRSHCH